MLNERTEEHLALFAEDREAAYFESPEELVEKTRYYLNNYAERAQIREAGWKKTTTGHNTYCDRLMQILLTVQPAALRMDTGSAETVPAAEA
jgi:spore maturation protein CgeB